MFCPKCGTENKEGGKFCAKCGCALGVETGPETIVVEGHKPNTETPLEASIESRDTAQGGTVTTINLQTPQVNKNPIGVAGFILALIGVFVSWIPVLGWVVWFLGALFSFIGLFKKPKGMAIAGIILTFIDLILLLFVVASCTAIGGGVAASLM